MPTALLSAISSTLDVFSFSNADMSTALKSAISSTLDLFCSQMPTALTSLQFNQRWMLFLSQMLAALTLTISSTSQMVSILVSNILKYYRQQNIFIFFGPLFLEQLFQLHYPKREASILMSFLFEVVS